MKQTRLVMGMPVTVEIVDKTDQAVFTDIFAYFTAVDKRYSTYKTNSEISQINRGLPKSKWSQEMQHVLNLCEQTKQATNGYFDIRHGGKLDPSGLVKGWAIQGAAGRLHKRGLRNFFIEAGGDIQVHGQPRSDEPWLVGIRSPFNEQEIVRTVAVTSEGVATSGTYIRGQHIYNPHRQHATVEEVVSLTVIAANIYEADRFATAAFAMGHRGIEFIESQPGLEGYMIDRDQIATYTNGFKQYVPVHV